MSDVGRSPRSLMKTRTMNLLLVGTSRFDVPARASAGGTGRRSTRRGRRSAPSLPGSWPAGRAVGSKGLFSKRRTSFASRVNLMAGLALSALGLSGVPAGAGGWQLATNLTLKADVALKETWDSNVYLQDEEPNRAAVPQAVAPFQESFVTSFTPRLTLDYKPVAAFNAALTYAPEVVFFHSASSEDHVAHRGTLNLGGQIEKVRWDFPNTLTIVQGSREGLYFGGDPLAAPPTGGNAPAIGGVPLRDRRAQLVYRCAPRATLPLGRWFLRPAMSGYLHDFQTEQKATASNPGYENYVDRRELNGGMDVGLEVAHGTRLVLGYRVRTGG